MAAQGDPLDRRFKPRIPRRLPVRFGTDARMCGGTVVDISEGGLRVESPEAFPVNSVILVFVQFPRHAVRLKARVAWAKSGEGSAGAMGLSFTQPEPTLARAYNEWREEVKLAAAHQAPEEPAAGAAAATPPSADHPPAPAPEKAQPRAAEPRGPVRRRLESRRGQTYDVLLERQAGGWRLTVVQLPRQIGVGAPDFEGTFPAYAAAEKALREFVKAH
ncbi:MAG: PilZ domain-containing protein [Acidobacteria bacterium]|nr:PilZ domain-containing protein [Acidobacteriota bacterium]